MTVVERFKHESMYGLSNKTSGGRCGEVAVSESLTIPISHSPLFTNVL